MQATAGVALHKALHSRVENLKVPHRAVFLLCVVSGWRGSGRGCAMAWAVRRRCVPPGRCPMTACAARQARCSGQRVPWGTRASLLQAPALLLRVP